MRRRLWHVKQPLRGSSAPLRCSLLETPVSWALTHTARSYTRQPAPSATADTYTFPQRQHHLSFKLSPTARRRTTAAVPFNQVEFADSINGNPHLPSRPPGGSAASSSEVTKPVRDPLSQRQTHYSEAPRTPPSTTRASKKPPKRTPATVASPALLASLEAQQSPFTATLRKRLTPRHTGPHGGVAYRPSAHQTDEERRTTDDLRAEEDCVIHGDGYDPALVVRTDARRRQVRLNPVQRELIWTARQRQYHGLLLRIVACLQSHRSPVEKCQVLFSLHGEVIRQHLRLRADTYEDIFHTLYSVGVKRGGGTGQPGKASLSTSAQLVPGDAQWANDLSGHEAANVNGGSLPAELASIAAVSSTVLSAHGMEHVWEMYRYAVDSGTNPSARMLQCVMGLLEHASVALAVGRSPPPAASTDALSYAPHTRRRVRSSGLLLVEAKAHSLMMDADRFHLTPTEYTVNSYVAICEACDVMHLAVARVTDYQTRHERQPTAGMYARLITGLVRCGHYADAMAVVTTMQNVPMSTYLLNAVLQAAQHSRDPSSAFTFYRALFFAPSSPLHTEGKPSEKGRRAAPPTRSSIRVAPSLVTFSILVEVMQATHSCVELEFVLAEMQHYRIKGNGMLLNKLLRLMEESGKVAEKKALRRAMESKDIRVFDEHRERRHLLCPM